MNETQIRNEERVLSLFAAHNEGPETILGSLEEIFDPEIVWTPAIIGGLEGGSYRGYDGLRRYYADRDDVFEGGRVEVLECEAVDDGAVVARVLSTGTGRASGASLEQDLWMYIRIRDGRVVRWHAFNTRAEAMGAAHA